jgi:hypothetical protein
MGVEQSSTVVSVVAVLVGVVEVLVDVDVLVEVEVLVDVEEVLVEVDVLEVPVVPVVRVVPVVPVGVERGFVWGCLGVRRNDDRLHHRFYPSGRQDDGDRQSADRQNLKNPPPSELSHPITPTEIVGGMKLVIRLESRNRAKISLSHRGLNHAASNTPTASARGNRGAGPERMGCRDAKAQWHVRGDLIM